MVGSRDDREEILLGPRLVQSRLSELNKHREKSEDAGWQLNVFRCRKYDREEIIQLMTGSDRVFRDILLCTRQCCGGAAESAAYRLLSTRRMLPICIYPSNKGRS